MYDYYKIFEQTKPQRIQLAEVTKILEEKMNELRVKKGELEEVNR